MEEARKVFVQIHIPKCGGGTLSYIAKRNFKSRYYSDSTLIVSQYSAKQLSHILHVRPWLGWLSSHNLSFDLPWELFDITIQAITIIRDPVDRFLSHYFYHRNHPRNTIVPEAKSLDLRDYINHALVQGNQAGYINGQLHYLTGDSSESSLQEVEELTANGNVLMFPLGRFDEVCVVLERLFPEELKNCSYIRQNVSQRDQAVTFDQRKQIAHFVERDRRLYNMADVLLDDFIKKLFTPSDFLIALDDFRKRCKRLQRINYFILPLRSAYSAIHRKVF